MNVKKQITILLAVSMLALTTPPAYARRLPNC